MDEFAPTLFIASSTEGLDYAYALQKGLAPAVECTVWSQGMFDLSDTSLQSLTRALGRFSYACFLLTADDVTSVRSTVVDTPRDNVIFRAGPVYRPPWS